MDNRNAYMGYVDGESAYSIVAHYHQCQPINRWKETNRRVFGCSHVRLHPCLTGQLEKIGALVNKTGQFLLNEATAFSLYAMTLKDQSQTLAQTMLYGNSKEISAKAKQLAFSLTLKHQIKYCPKCAQEDFTRHSRFVWRINHQVYGVNWCQKHNLGLYCVDCGEGGINRRYIPPELTLEPDSIVISDRSRHFSAFIEDLSCYLRRKPIIYPLYKYYQFHLDERGYLTKHQNIRMRHLRPDLFEFWKPLFSEFNQVIPLELSSFHDISQTVWSERPTHYLKHVLLMAYFSHSPEEFFSINERSQCQSEILITKKTWLMKIKL